MLLQEMVMEGRILFDFVTNPSPFWIVNVLLWMSIHSHRIATVRLVFSREVSSAQCLEYLVPTSEK